MGEGRAKDIWRDGKADVPRLQYRLLWNSYQQRSMAARGKKKKRGMEGQSEKDNDGRDGQRPYQRLYYCREAKKEDGAQIRGDMPNTHARTNT